MSLQSLSTCTSAFHLEPAGVVGGQLIDQTAHGNHLALHTGTPLYATRDGIEMMDFDNSFWFEGPNLWLTGFSIAVVGAMNMAGNEGNLSLVNTTIKKIAVLGNFVGADEKTDADWFSSTYQMKSVAFGQSRAVVIGDRSGSAASTALFTNEQAGLAVGCFDIPASTVNAAKNADAVTSVAIASGGTTARDGAVMRIGHLKAAFPAQSAGRYVSAKRLYIFAGNVFDHPGFAAARDAEIAAWGI